MHPQLPSSDVRRHSHWLRFARWAALAGCGALAAFLVGATSVPTHRPPESERAGPDHDLPTTTATTTDVHPDELKAAMHSAADYLVRATGRDGQFVYRVHLDPQAKVHRRYNMLRHAGSMFALASYYDRYPSSDVLAALRRQADFLKRTGMGPVDGNDQMLAVWSHPNLTGAKGPPCAKLGGAGLALVALLSIEQIDPGTTELEDLRRLGNFIVWMQKPDGSFYSKQIPSQGGRSDAWTSLYYPGEAALGLVMLYEIDPSPLWLESAAKCLAFLARSRADQDVVEADHWALLATQRILPHGEKCQHIASEEHLVRHAQQICGSVLAQRHPHPDHSPRSGSFMQDGRTCPTATRLEGLQAALTFLPEDGSPAPGQVRAAIEPGVAFLLRTQVQYGGYVGGIPRAHGNQPDRAEFRDFNRRAREVRIDYVQHALSAMLQFEDARRGN